jgi:hypothetical protein
MLAIEACRYEQGPRWDEVGRALVPAPVRRRPSGAFRSLQRVHNGTNAGRVMSYRRSTVRKDDHVFGSRDHISTVGTIADPVGSECQPSGRNEHRGSADCSRPRPAHARLIEDARILLLLTLAFPLVVLIVGAPVALVVRLLIEIGRRW